MASSRSVNVLFPIVVSAAVLATGCGGGDGGDTKARQTGDRVAPAGTGYTSDQLRQALPTELLGYRRTGEPEAGEYGSLKSIQNFNQLQQRVTYDKPECSRITGAGTTSDTGLRTVPASVAIFGKGRGQSASVALMAVPPSVAQQHVQVRMPAECKTFRIKIGDRWSKHEVVEAGPGNVGQGSRIVGVATTSGKSAVKTWYVVLRGQGYMATIALFGPTVTRAQAEQLARQAHDHAERILP
ncbi:hypothetical protein SAMN04489712_12468 [Thermomonospora echinospora]|uniref:PknH-like extracellular domain-containing protein n=1 Tax=Thermomonospora echinospora TaxID=1992 RepID=A0A1H6DYG8_9ACTN|nr:hypothetical protein [Thermomonospora echinospora]SEG89796.1 hypothetical protein SAMN04489712_12468 [Thermomonospora echinospora]